MLTTALTFVALLGAGPGPGSIACETCGGRPSAVTALIVRLQQAPDRKTRERAAHDIRNVNWQRHPEVAGALAFSLLNDPDEDVREEVAQSLTKMRVADPAVVEALTRAASGDPDRATRRWARRALTAMEGPRGPVLGLIASRRVVLRPRVLGEAPVFPLPTFAGPVLKTLPGTPLDTGPAPVIEVPATADPLPPALPTPSLQPEGNLEPIPTTLGVDSRVSPLDDLAPVVNPDEVTPPPLRRLHSPTRPRARP